MVLFNLSPIAMYRSTEALQLNTLVFLAVVLTQIEATVLTAVVTVLVMYCCCKTVRVKKTRTLEVDNRNGMTTKLVTVGTYKMMKISSFDPL